MSSSVVVPHYPITVLAMRGPRQSGKSTALVAAGIAIAASHPEHPVVFVAPVHVMVREAKKRLGYDAPKNFLWLSAHNWKRLEDRLAKINPTLILLDEAQSMGFPGAAQFANRLAKKFKTSVWFTENECDYREDIL